jgi:hypothetical protein
MESEDRPHSRAAERWLALLPLAVMTWTIWDVATHEFNRWTMLRTVLLVIFSLPAMIGAILGGTVGFRVGSTIGLGLVLFGLAVGMIVIRVFLV